MANEILAERRRALEEAFFARAEEHARQRLRARAEHAARRDALRRAAGVADAHLLEELLARDIDAESVRAFALLPLAEVAWADGRVDDAERDAVRDAAARHGLGPAGTELLTAFLAARPDDELRAAWRAYAGALRASQAPEEREAWRRSMLDDARSVASASGGFLGFGEAVSNAEAALLTEIDAALR